MADAAYSEDSEEWRDIPGWDGYQASSLGRIRSLDRTRIQLMPDGSMQPVLYPGRIRKLSQCATTKYIKVGLSNLQHGKRRTMAVHILVCSTFHGERPARHDVAHYNNDRTDNRASNLRWATRRENKADSIRHCTVNSGERNGQAKITDRQCEAMRSARAQGASARELAAKYSLSQGHVFDILARRRRA